MAASTASPKIAIIGAGPGGLTLASLLARSSIPYTVFDLRPRPASNFTSIPSGSLDLHEESGLRALQSCGLFEKFSTLTSECSEDMILADKTGTVKYEDDGQGGNRPEISRNSLTELLLSTVPEGNIKWEHKVLSITHLSSSSSTINLSHLNQQYSEEFNLVVGADGAWSKVRSLITETIPHFSGINCVTITIPNITTKHPHLSSMVGKGTYSAVGSGNAVMSQRGSLDSARIYLMISSDSETYLKDSGLESASMNHSEMKNKLLNDSALFANWGEKLKELVATGCDAEETTGEPISAKPLYMLPTDFAYPHTPGLTLLGDAAHLMTPFAGEGVNVAMLDAVELAEAIVSTFKKGKDVTLVEKVKEYEIGMWKRMHPISEGTSNNLDMIFKDENAPSEFVKFFESHGPPPEGE